MKSLYREYRPKTFNQVIGQDHIIKILQNQIKNNKIAHAYLFCGNRGTGKTTVAKIFSTMIVNSPQQQGNKAMLSLGLDIFEIDAASNNSVQDVRDIIDKVKYPPVSGKYKVYIIDEVHMFSSSAFNAFLKTLEEPPAHAIFILCTTEPHKLLPTVQSRCLRFDFRPASAEAIQKLLKDILKKENIAASLEAVKLLAEAGCGSFRDALSFTETVINYCGEKEITEDDVVTVLGTVSSETLKSLLTEIVNGNTKKITQICAETFKKGINAGILVKNFLSVIKAEFLKNPAVYGKIFKLFSELELSIKTSPDVFWQFENTCLLASGVYA